MSLIICNISNIVARILAGVVVVAILMVESGHMAHAATSTVNTSAAFSEAVAHPAYAGRKLMHAHAHMQINDEKPSDQLGSMMGDCITLSCCFVVDERLRSFPPLFIFGLSKYLNLNSLPSKANAVMVHKRPPRTI